MSEPRFDSAVLRWTGASLGIVVLVVGFAGFVVPGLPGTPLLLVAAWLFARSNERLYRWMITNRWFGRSIADYRDGLGIPRRTKLVAVTMVTFVVTLSVLFGLELLWMRLVVAVLGLTGVAFILTRSTREVVTTPT